MGAPAAATPLPAGCAPLLRILISASTPSSLPCPQWAAVWIRSIPVHSLELRRAGERRPPSFAAGPSAERRHGSSRGRAGERNVREDCVEERERDAFLRPTSFDSQNGCLVCLFRWRTISIGKTTVRDPNTVCVSCWRQSEGELLRGLFTTSSQTNFPVCSLFRFRLQMLFDLSSDYIPMHYFATLSLGFSFIFNHISKVIRFRQDCSG